MLQAVVHYTGTGMVHHEIVTGQMVSIGDIGVLLEIAGGLFEPGIGCSVGEMKNDARIGRGDPSHGFSQAALGMPEVCPGGDENTGSSIFGEYGFRTAEGRSIQGRTDELKGLGPVAWKLDFPNTQRKDTLGGINGLTAISPLNTRKINPAHRPPET